MSELKVVSAIAPSNIALIKYMGKKDAASNLPENGSISMTLRNLCTLAELTLEAEAGPARWLPEMPAAALDSKLSFAPPSLSGKGEARILRHVERVRGFARENLPAYGIELAVSEDKAWTLRTANTFPQGSGIASSASAFAAVTLATAAACARDARAFAREWERNISLKHALARISRQGSGSSCRSFEGPWVYWEEEDARTLDTPKMPRMAHFVLVVSEKEKQVSSSEAHLQVSTSPLWEGRVQRVEGRLKALRTALGMGDLPTVARIAWAEAWEMHSLFHTAAEPFTYWEPETVGVLKELAIAQHEPVPPIVTLDAGPNVHVIVDEAQRGEWQGRLGRLAAARTGVRLLEDGEGDGASLVFAGAAS